jgi:hypothetical protein
MVIDQWTIAPAPAMRRAKSRTRRWVRERDVVSVTLQTRATGRVEVAGQQP